MNKKVVLYLTSPSTWARRDMSLNNFKQLQKLGYDIITLTTNDFLSPYIYEHSKVVIHDYTEQVCESKDYYNYFKRTDLYGYFTWKRTDSHLSRFFSNTNFPSVLRNIKTLIQFANSMGYDEYFYCEDDHYFHDDDLNKLNIYYNQLDKNDLLVFTFNFCPDDDISRIYCSYFHFGQVKKMINITKEFAYNSREFINRDPDIYMYAFETFFKNLILKHKPADFVISEVFTDDGFTSIFKNSKINMVFSYTRLDDPMRCNFVYDTRTNTKPFYYDSSGLLEPTNLKLYINDVLNYESTLHPGRWVSYPIPDELINNTVVVINDKVVKSFKNLNINNIIYNGQLSN